MSHRDNVRKFVILLRLINDLLHTCNQHTVLPIPATYSVFGELRHRASLHLISCGHKNTWPLNTATYSARGVPAWP